MIREPFPVSPEVAAAFPVSDWKPTIPERSAAYSREWALALSDDLAALGQSHTIVVGVRDGYMPRERYSVNVTPILSFSPTDISALQRLADRHDLGVAYINGSFTFTGAERG